MTTPTSLRIPDETRLGFEELANASGRGRSELMIEALEEYLATGRQRIALIQEGERAMSEGRSRDHASVIALLESRGVLSAGYSELAEDQRT